MSGTSLDGVDMALCEFSKNDGGWKFRVDSCTTAPYNRMWRETLSKAHTLSGEKLIALHNRYGKYLGALAQKFLRYHNNPSVDFIASHGHTIFHQPAAGFTFQLGDGSALSSASGLPVIFDFRNLDVQLGGQGAPLVPVGDRLLFHQFDVCVNLGGIANLSFEQKGKRLAWDICFVNMGLNYLSSELGKKFDRGGAFARSGKVQLRLLRQLQNTEKKIKGNRPSLAREHFEKFILPLLENRKDGIALKDKMRTFTEYSATAISKAISSTKGKSILLTGGGAHNSFLVERIVALCGPQVKIEVGSKQIIDFKEAIIFAFLGVLRREGIDNAFRSVTGASRDSCGGIIVGL